jgi:thioredoxin-like negative regulator of GroEL
MKQLWYFSADWCGPCKQFGPIMDELAKPCPARPQGISIKKLNVDYIPDVAKIYKVKSVPTVILVENEQEKARFTGALPMHKVIEFYNQ